MRIRTAAVLVVVMLLLINGCGWFCSNREALTNTFQMAQAGYKTYVDESGTDDKNIILADQILSIASPFVVGAAKGACPPDAVVAEAQKRAAQLIPVAPANPTPAP